MFTRCIIYNYYESKYYIIKINRQTGNLMIDVLNKLLSHLELSMDMSLFAGEYLMCILELFTGKNENLFLELNELTLELKFAIGSGKYM